MGWHHPGDGPDEGSPSDWIVLVVLTVHNLESPGVVYIFVTLARGPPAGIVLIVLDHGGDAES